jgi:hypothetical protein
VLHLRVYGASGAIAAVGERLEDGGSARHVALAPAVRADHTLLTAEITPAPGHDQIDFLSLKVTSSDKRTAPPNP